MLVDNDREEPLIGMSQGLLVDDKRVELLTYGDLDEIMTYERWGSLCVESRPGYCRLDRTRLGTD